MKHTLHVSTFQLQILTEVMEHQCNQPDSSPRENVLWEYLQNVRSSDEYRENLQKQESTLDLDEIPF